MSAAMQSFHGDLVRCVEPKWISSIVVGIETAINASFLTDEVLRPVRTRDEIERRFRICIRWFVTLRKELHWSVPRILDVMPAILRNELDGGHYQPDESHAGWVKRIADDGLRVDDDAPDMSGPVKEVAAVETATKETR
jgi:hypothetical protein